MDPCHTKPFIRPGVVIETAARSAADSSSHDALPDAANTANTPNASAGEPSCDYCGATALEWRKCKLICTSCRQINKSCADL